MVATDRPVPPPGRSGVTFAEIAAHYGLAARYIAENPRWGRHPDWPARTGKRGRSGEFDPAAVADFVRAHHARPVLDLEPERTYTVTEAATAAGIEADTVYADISRGRWPAPDVIADDGTRLWYGRTITATLAARRSYNRTSDK